MEGLVFQIYENEGKNARGKWQWCILENRVIAIPLEERDRNDLSLKVDHYRENTELLRS